MSSPSVRVAATFALLLAAGCQHVGTQSSARTIDKNGTRLSVGVGAGTWVDGDVILLAPAIQGRLQYGIDDLVEFVLSGGTDGVGAHVKIAMVRPASDRVGLNVGLEPGLSVGPSTWGSDPYGLRSMVQLPLLVGYRLGGHELVLGPRFLYAATLGVGNSQAVFGGTTLGVTLRFGGFTVTPEVGVMGRLLWAGNVPSFLPVVNLGFGRE